MSAAWRTLLPPARYLLLAGVMVLLLLWGALPHRPALPPTASQRARHPNGITQALYRALPFRQRDGTPTTYAQAAALLGEGALLSTSPDGHTRVYQWNGGGRWARMEATFRDGYLISKMQFGLPHS